VRIIFFLKQGSDGEETTKLVEQFHHLMKATKVLPSGQQKIIL